MAAGNKETIQGGCRRLCTGGTVEPWDSYIRRVEALRSQTLSPRSERTFRVVSSVPGAEVTGLLVAGEARVVRSAHSTPPIRTTSRIIDISREELEYHGAIDLEQRPSSISS